MEIVKLDQIRTLELFFEYRMRGYDTLWFNRRSLNQFYIEYGGRPVSYSTSSSVRGIQFDTESQALLFLLKWGK